MHLGVGALQPNDELLSVERGEIEAAGYRYVREWQAEGVIATAEGLREPSGRIEERQAWRGDGYERKSTMEDDGAGTVRTEFDVFEDATRREGFWEQGKDGLTHWEYTRTTPWAEEAWEFTLDLANTGEGTVVFADDPDRDCVVSFQERSCTFRCDGMASVSCPDALVR